MKLLFDEWELGAQIHLEPDDLKEVAKLARLASNAKKEAPTIRMEFRENGTPYLYVWFKKREARQQKNFIKPYDV